MNLFDRRCTVDLDTIHVDGLTVRFNVELDPGNLGKAQIQVVNLNEAHRKRLEETAHRLNDAGQPVGIPVKLSVGYAESSLGTLFSGKCREVFSQRDPPEWITTVKTWDGDIAPQTRVAESFGAGTDKAAVFKRLVDNLKTAGIDPGNALEMFNQGNYTDGVKTLLHGGAFHGPAWPQVQKMLKDANLEGQIQDGSLVITAIDQPLASTAVLLDRDHGLIGSPQAGARTTDKTSKIAVLKVRALIQPGLRPKRKVQVESQLVSGLYQIRKAQYKGDLRSTEWYADLECTAL